MPKREGIIRRMNTIANRGGNFLRIAPMRMGHRLMVDLRSGTEFRSFYTGEYDELVLRKVMNLIEPGCAVLDVGANIGFWSVPMSRRCSEINGELIAVEPAPTNFERLVRNLEMNGLSGIATCLNVALSDHAGEASLSLREDFAAGATTGNDAIVEGTSDFPTVKVKLERADEAILRRLTRRCGLVKLDIEGHEGAFLRGARALLERDRPIIICELNQSYVGCAAEVEAALGNMSYKYARLEDGAVSHVNSFSSPHQIDDVFLVPEERMDDTLGRLNTPMHSH